MQKRIFLNKHFVSLATGFFVFIFYFYCLSSTLTYGGDCGELIAASWTGGIPHPTGYPLYAMLGWIFSHLLIFGEVAWRYNVFSALMGSIAVAFVAASVLRLTQNHLAAIIAAFSLAGSYFFASQSVIAETYALNGALIALLFYSAIRWKLDHQWGWLATLALGVGLIPNSHLSSIYLLPGLLIFLWPHHPKVLLRQYPKQLIGLALALIWGFSCTLYLPWRSKTFPSPASGPGGTQIYQPGDWGHPATLTNWWNHVTAKQYRSLLWDDSKVHIGNAQFTVPTFTQPLSHAFGQMRDWLGHVALQYLWLILLTLVGAIVCWKLSPHLGWLLWLPFILNLFFQSNYNVKGVADIANFLFPCYIIIAIWTGIGYNAASKVLLCQTSQKQNFAQMLLQVFAISAIAIQVIMVYPAINHRNDTRAKDTALERTAAVKKLQESTGKNVTILMWGDDTLFPFWYAQRVLGQTPAAQTPWGPYRHYYFDNGKMMDLVRKLHTANPLAVAEWNSQINAAYPLIPLNESGTLWLASNRKLAEPAKVLSASKNSAPKLNIPSVIKSGELFKSTLDFDFDPAGRKIIKRDDVNQTIQISWIEISYLAANAPFEKTSDTQRIPLVIPATLQHSARLQMILPLEVPRIFPHTTCDIWIRLGNTDWQHAATTPLYR